MNRSWTALAVALVAILAGLGCNDYGNTFQGNTGAFITSLSPANVNAGGPDFTLTVNGSGFIAKTVVQWNGKNLVTTLTTDSNGNVLTVTAVVPAAMTAKAGSAVVQTLSPHSGAGNNGLSNPIAFQIFPPPNPLPVLSSIAPSCAVTGSGPFTLTLTGSKFIPASDPSGGSQVNWNAGASQTPLPIVGTISSSQIQATVSKSLVANAGTATITVNNPPVPNSPSGGGGPSNPLTFTVAGVCPAIVKSAASSTAAAQIVVVEETPSVSLDGRYVAFTAAQGDRAQVFLRDTCQGAPASCQQRTILLSVTDDGSPADEDSRSPSMSSDGRFVAFSSAARNLTESAPGGRQVYLRDTCLGAAASCKPSTQLISTDVNGALVSTESILPSVSASGRFVAFLAITASHAPNSQSSANSGFRQVFVRDTCFGAVGCTPATKRISLQPGDAPATGDKPAGPAISGSAGHVAIAGGGTAMLFTRSVPVDDRVVLSILKENQ